MIHLDKPYRDPVMDYINRLSANMPYQRRRNVGALFGLWTWAPDPADDYTRAVFLVGYLRRHLTAMERRLLFDAGYKLMEV